MPLLSRQDELGEYKPKAWQFWRNIMVYFCVFSVLGHWLEIVYCTFMRLFGIYDPDSLVWSDPWYPFLVYGIGAILCAVALIPLKEKLIYHRKTVWGAGIQFFIITVIICMLMELAMGFMLNQPNAAGEYPLWDNSELPLNILGQAWLVNDIVLGGAATVYTWLLYPLCDKALAKIPSPLMNVFSAVIIVGFIVLCTFKFV